MIKIEKGIPMPEVQAGSKPKYPFLEMEIGDSFFVEGAPQSLLTSAASNHAKRYGGRFSVRKQYGGVRVWRVE